MEDGQIEVMKGKEQTKKGKRRKANEEERMGEPVTPLTNYLVFLKKEIKMDGQDLILDI